MTHFVSTLLFNLMLSTDYSCIKIHTCAFSLEKFVVTVDISSHFVASLISNFGLISYSSKDRENFKPRHLFVYAKINSL